jgi:hypothetical protein
MTLRLKLNLNDSLVGMLRDIVTSEKQREKGLTEEVWVFRQLRQLAGNHAAAWRSIEAKGSWEGFAVAGRTMQVTRDALHEFPLDAGQGNFEVLLGDRILDSLQHTCALVEATNRLSGRPVPWTTAHEWLERYIEETIILGMAKVDNEDLEEEEKDLTDSSKDAP